MDVLKSSFKDVNLEDMMLTSITVIIVFFVLTQSKLIKLNNFNNHFINVTIFQSIMTAMFVIVWVIMDYAGIQGVPQVNLAILMLVLTVTQQLVFLILNNTIIKKSSNPSTKPSILQFMWIPFTFLIPLVLFVLNQVFDNLTEYDMVGIIFKWIKLTDDSPAIVYVLYYLITEFVFSLLYSFYTTFAKSSTATIHMLCGSEDSKYIATIGNDLYVTTQCIPNIQTDISLFTSFTKTLMLMILSVYVFKSRNGSN